MQLFALDSHEQLISAFKADKSKDYFCFECQAVVRRRSGPHRQPHFYHLNQTAQCHLSGKGMAHLQIQCRFAELLPKEECFIELRFPSIGRIADIAWISKKLIFEIQCSPISAFEIEARNRDYASAGFQVIWILHDRQFNKQRVSGAEFALMDHPHYFSNINMQGQGIIYDQFDIKKRGKRAQKLAPLPVDLSQPLDNHAKLIRPTWPLFFAGDLVALHLQGSSEYLYQIRALQQAERLPKKSFMEWSFSLLENWVIKPYLALLQMLLERACR